MTVWISLLLSFWVEKKLQVHFELVVALLTNQLVSHFTQKRYKMTTLNGEIIIANNFWALMDVLLIKKKLMVKQNVNKITQILGLC